MRGRESQRPGRLLISGFVAIIVVIWAVNFIAAKIGLRHIPALAMGSLRVVFAAITLMPVYLLASRAPAFAAAKEARGTGFSPSDLWVFA